MKIKGLNWLFLTPALIFFSILVYGVLSLLQFSDTVRNPIVITAIAIGSVGLIKDSIKSLISGKLSLDYIAILAILTGLITQQYVVAAIIVLMLSGGNALEDYAVKKARKSLTSLASRLPDTVIMRENGQLGELKKVDEVKVGEEIIARKGEVIPLDGELISNEASIDQSSVTGESLPTTLYRGDIIRSGTLNLGDLIVFKAVKESKNSSYNKIIELVREAESEKSPMVRLADKYNYLFTILTVLIATYAYLTSDYNLERVLAVLVIATPCPLILATPVALIGGVNSSARANIIVKRVAALEALARVDTMVLDKTGTITLGEPVLSEIKVVKGEITPENALKIAASIERSSLHPFAKAIVKVAQESELGVVTVSEIHEEVGNGIFGKVGSNQYHLKKGKDASGIDLLRDSKTVARFYFNEVAKKDSKGIFEQLRGLGYKLNIFTGDKEEKAKAIIENLGIQDVRLKAECKPEDKLNGIKELKQDGKTIVMIGDGINDAPALAAADVGMVFSNSEQTASSEAADIVFLRNDLFAIINIIQISKSTINIAMQSILVGLGLSLGGMILASFGLIPPVVGAFMQEGIDILVILNALRASRV